MYLGSILASHDLSWTFGSILDFSVPILTLVFFSSNTQKSSIWSILIFQHIFRPILVIQWSNHCGTFSMFGQYILGHSRLTYGQVHTQTSTYQPLSFEFDIGLHCWLIELASWGSLYLRLLEIFNETCLLMHVVLRAFTNTTLVRPTKWPQYTCMYTSFGMDC